MAADAISAIEASPSFIFTGQEFFHAMLFDKPEVVYHAHVILGLVALVQVL
jgi:hypothetical protein